MTDNFIPAIGLLAVADASLFIWARLISGSERAQSTAGYPVFLAITSCLLALLGHFLFFIFACALSGELPIMFFVSLVTGAAPALAFGNILMSSTSTTASNLLYGEGKDAKKETDLMAARKRVKEGDVEGALAEYGKVARLWPDSPDPLFAMCALLEHENRFNEAAVTYREIIARFQNDNVTWIKASKNLAELLREKLEDEESAEIILEAIENRHSDARFGYLAEERRYDMHRGSTALEEEEAGVRDMEQARRLVDKGNIDKAVALYGRYARGNPSESRPLFEAASALELAGRYPDSLATLQQITRAFDEDAEVWGKAALRIATLKENHLEDFEAAKGILMEVVNRLGPSDNGRLARQRLDALEGRVGD